MATPISSKPPGSTSADSTDAPARPSPSLLREHSGRAESLFLQERLASERRTIALLLAALALAALAVVSPAFFRGSASGHDFDFHLASWMDVARQWREGTFYPRWAEWANYGYGEPRFIFYPPLSWLLGAALGTVLPWRAAPGAFIWISLVLAGVSMFVLARRWLPPVDAIGAALLYAVNPYHLLVACFRSDFAELLASALVPLAVHFALECGRDPAPRPDAAAPQRRSLRGIAPLAVVYAAIWLANAPAAVITNYGLALVLVVLAIMRRSWRTFFAGGAALALGLALAAFYIVPAAYEQRWVNIQQVLSSGLRPDENFIFTTINDPEHNQFNLLVSTLAAAEIVITALATLVVPRERARELCWSLAALGLLSTALMLHQTRFAWELLPKLRFVQFPWRWLVPLGVAFAFFAAAAVRHARLRWLWIALLPLLLVGTGAYIMQQAWWDSEGIRVLHKAIYGNQGYEGSDEYNALDRDHEDLPVKAPRVGIVRDSGIAPPDSSAGVAIERWRGQEKVFTVESREPVVVALRLLDYPAWRVTVNGGEVQTQSNANTGQMRIALPAGASHVRVGFHRTNDIRAGDLLSLAAAGVLAWFLRISRRR